MINNKLLVALLLLASVSVLRVSSQLQTLRTLAEWKVLEFEFPTDADREAALATQDYIPGSGVPIDNGVYYDPGNNNEFIKALNIYIFNLPNN